MIKENKLKLENVIKLLNDTKMVLGKSDEDGTTFKTEENKKKQIVEWLSELQERWNGSFKEKYAEWVEFTNFHENGCSYALGLYANHFKCSHCNNSVFVYLDRENLPNRCPYCGSIMNQKQEEGKKGETQKKEEALSEKVFDFELSVAKPKSYPFSIIKISTIQDLKEVYDQAQAVSSDFDRNKLIIDFEDNSICVYNGKIE